MEMITKSIINKAVLMICALVLIISLAACGAQNDTKETAASTQAAAPSATEAPASSAADAAVIETEAQAAANTDLIGSWDYAELSGMVYTFNADGTGTYDLFGEVMKFTYEVDGSALKIMYVDADVDEPMVLEYKLDGDTLNIKDSLGSDTIYKRK